MSSFNVGLIFTPEVYTLCQKVEYAGAPRFKYIYIYIYIYTLYNSKSKLVYHQMFIKTRHFHLTYIFTIVSSQNVSLLCKVYCCIMIKPSCKYFGRVLAKHPVIN